MSNKGPDESQNLYRITSAYAIVILMIIASIIGIFTVTLAIDDVSEDTSPGTRGTGAESHIDELKLKAGDDAGWNDPKTTALAVIALFSAAVEPGETWQNSNSVEISMMHSQYPNSLDVLTTFIEKPQWYAEEAVIDVEEFSLNLLAIQALDPDYNEKSALAALTDEQDAETGSWNDDVYQTALASYTISIISSPSLDSVTKGINYLKSVEVDLSWDTVLDSSLSILALHAADLDVSSELKELVTHVEADNSLGLVESTAWAVAAISVDPSGSTFETGQDAQNWLADGDTADLSTTELALSIMGESISFSPLGSGDTTDDKSDEVQPPDGNYTEDTNGSLGPESTEEEEALPFWRDPDLEKGMDEGADDSNGDFSYDDGVVESPSSFFSGDNLLWMIVAIASILIIVSLATYGLIARIEEGKALDGVRRDIVEYIRHNPGEHFAGIMHEFDMSPSSTTYHLKVLEDTEQVVAHKDNKYKRFYLAGNTIPMQAQTNDYKELMSVLKNATSRKVVWNLLANQGASQKQVAEALGIHPSTVNWHANRLKEIGILEKVKAGKEVAYTIIKEDSVRSVMAIIEEGT